MEVAFHRRPHDLDPEQPTLRPRSDNGYGINRPYTDLYEGQTGIKYKVMFVFRVRE
jgi:hypothetical protein